MATSHRSHGEPTAGSVTVRCWPVGWDPHPAVHRGSSRGWGDAWASLGLLVHTVPLRQSWALLLLFHSQAGTWSLPWPRSLWCHAQSSCWHHAPVAKAPVPRELRCYGGSTWRWETAPVRGLRLTGALHQAWSVTARVLSLYIYGSSTNRQMIFP